MAVKEICSYEVSCDRCGETKTLDYNPVDDPDRSEGYQFWSRLSADGPWTTKQKMLCTLCADLLELFLRGPNGNNPAAVFNRDEAGRFQAALDYAHDQFARNPEFSPWD